MGESTAQLDDRLLSLLSQAFAPDEVEPPLDGLRALRQALRRNGPSPMWAQASASDVRSLSARPSGDLRGSRSHGWLALGTVGAILFIMATLVWSVSRGGTGSTVAATDLQLATTALHHDLSGSGPLPPSTRHDADKLAHSILALPAADRPQAGTTPETLLAQACHRLSGPLPPYCSIPSPPTSSPLASPPAAAPPSVPMTSPPNPDGVGAQPPIGFGNDDPSAPVGRPGDANPFSGQGVGSQPPSNTSIPSSPLGQPPATTQTSSGTPPTPSDSQGFGAGGTGVSGPSSQAGGTVTDRRPSDGNPPSWPTVTGR